MPKIVASLTDVQVKNAKSKDKAYKLFDGGGLYLEVMPVGSRIWRMKYTQANGKESRLTTPTAKAKKIGTQTAVP